MDARLLMAISDVLAGVDLTNTITAGPRPSAAVSAVRESTLKTAAMKNASTGTPIPLLRGIAAERATMAAVGGGAKYAGGAGMAGGEKFLSEKSLQAQLAVYGIKSAAIVAQIAIRYAVLVRRDRKTALEIQTDEN